MPDTVLDPYDLPPRRETCLARFSRNAKLSGTAVVFLLMALPFALLQDRSHDVLHRSRPNLPTAQQEVEPAPPLPTRISTDVNAPALNDQNEKPRLVQAPDVRVTEDTSEGPLPRIGEDGSRPWQIYARPFNAADKRPRIALVVTDLGMSRMITDQAISQLPPAVTLSFSSQGPVVAAWGSRARQDGHEILLQVPVEPFDFPHSDPGPNTLLLNLSNSENLSRLLKALRRGNGYVGLTTAYGSVFTSDPQKFSVLLQQAHDRGLMVLDSRMSPRSVVTDMSRDAGVPVATVTQRLDGDLAPEAIQAALASLEKTAQLKGRAIGITSATPLMLAQIQEWARTLPDRGVALAPVSAMVQ